jgi:hypothetical protein
MEAEGGMLLIIMILAIIAVVFSFLAWANSGGANNAASNLAQHFNSTIGSMNSNMSVALAYLKPIATRQNNQSNSIANLSLELGTGNGKIVNSISSVSTNLSQKIQPGFASVNKNVSGIQSSVNQTLKNFTNNIQNYLGNKSIAGKAITINQSTKTIPGSSYKFGMMLPGFANHLNFSAGNVSVTLDILTPQNYAYFATDNSFGIYRSYTGTSQNIWFNVTAGCKGFIYVITDGTNSPVTLTTNISAIYEPSGLTDGVCS